tara:strand:- start:1715 stop:1927 length:213 start_codon:yes stop_codon:yes gene_type:complete
MVNLKNPTMIVLGGLLVVFLGILRPYLKRLVAREILGDDVSEQFIAGFLIFFVSLVWVLQKYWRNLSKKK